jgi:hypothetical protein
MFFYVLDDKLAIRLNEGKKEPRMEIAGER